MKQKHIDYKVVPYPKIRRLMAAEFRSSHHMPMIHGLLEVDVSRARTFLRDYKARTGESLSFTAFLIACLAKAVDEHKAVQARRFGSKRLILFDEVDVLTDIERDVGGQKFVVPHIVRAANRKTFRELHGEIRAAQGADGKNVLKRFRLLFLPAVLYRPFLWALAWIGRWRPRLWKTIVGTVEISAVGMFGNGAGWGIPPATATALMVTVGGIGEEPGIVDRHIAIREYLSLTISFDHDVIDGAPAARFTQRLKELIESGYGLRDSTTASEQTPLSGEVNHVYNSREGIAYEKPDTRGVP
jgi:pyruvate/2-oxoglutarate dehydrogenase complex dihydrolipoamide acyltransferase (E2) component